MRSLLLPAGLCAAALATSLPAHAEDPQPAAAPPRALTAEQLAAIIPYDCNFAQKLTLGTAVCQERQALAIRRRIGELIGKGRCDQAAAEARKTGDTAFAGRVQSACEEEHGGAQLAAQH